MGRPPTPDETHDATRVYLTEIYDQAPTPVQVVTATELAEMAGGGSTTLHTHSGLSSPLTTKGDLHGYSTVDARLGVGSNGQVVTADSAQTIGFKWAASGTTTTQDVQIRYVDPVAGNDTTGDGLDWPSAYATIQKAHDDFSNTQPDMGGTIYVGEGTLAEGDINITNRSTHIIGMGWHTTVIEIPAGATNGIKITADYCSVRDLRIQPASFTATQVGLFVKDAQFCFAERIYVFKVGRDDTTNRSALLTAAGIKIEGGTTFADWFQLRGARIEECNRGFVMSGGGAQCYMLHTIIQKSRFENVWCYRQIIGGGAFPSATLMAVTCWFSNKGQVADFEDGFNIRTEVDSGETNKSSEFRLINCVSELGGSSGRNHIFLGGKYQWLDGIDFAGGGSVTNNPPTAVEFGSDSEHCHILRYHTSGESHGHPGFTNNGHVSNTVSAWAGTALKAGVPNDADVSNKAFDGAQMFIDTTNNRLYVRYGGSWHYASLT